MSFDCPVCGEASNEYAPWYKASRGTLASHLYNAHAEELAQRLRNPRDSVIEALRDKNGLIVAVGGPLLIKISYRRKARR